MSRPKLSNFAMVFMASFFSCGIALASDALTGMQRAALDHYASLLAALKTCPDLTHDDALVSAGMALAGADTRDPAQWRLVEERFASERAALARLGPQAGCAAALDLYGPDGAAVPGWLMQR